MRVGAFLGVALLYALLVGGLILAVDNALDLDRGLLEDTRTPVPGSRVLQLDASKYNVFFEARELHGSDAPPLRVQVRPLGSGRPIELKDYSGKYTMSGDRDATAFATVRIPRSGRYRVSVRGPEIQPFSDPTIALGEPIGRRVIRIVAGALLALVCFLAGTGLLIAALIWRPRPRA
jgi:hypothetical protein